MKYRTSQIVEVEVNEWIETLDECSSFVYEIDNNLNIEEVHIYNDGCKPRLVKRLQKYLENLDLNVYVFNRAMGV
jgi:hypothetical protein